MSDLHDYELNKSQPKGLEHEIKIQGIKDKDSEPRFFF